jgi:hypothetical protein
VEREVVERERNSGEREREREREREINTSWIGITTILTSYTKYRHFLHYTI